MKKDKKKVVIILGALVAMCILAGVIVFLLNGASKESETLGNKANVEWYSVEEKEFVLKTADDLYGFLALSDFYDFAGQTIKLGADIVVNEGNAADWAEQAPTRRWNPIRGFAGTFDGQGHSISGLYGKGIDVSMGLFAETTKKAVIKNFKLCNSYFRVDGDVPVGSITANGSGTFDKIYSNAILTSNRENCGGIIGEANAGVGTSATGSWTSINNCWFDGEVRLTTQTGRFGGGIIGKVTGGTAVIQHCLNSGTISCEAKLSSGQHIGGLVGGLYYSNYSGTLNIIDSLNVGKIEVEHESCVGAVLGRSFAKTALVMEETYATLECFPRAWSFLEGSLQGGVVQLSETKLKGFSGYQWTDLDFENFWAVDMDDAPILKAFADEVPSLAGLEKAYDTSWYNENAKEFVLYDLKDLYGLVKISRSDNFVGKTVKLGADIVVNEGKASEWSKNPPKDIWDPIGTTKGFSGTFDGQGHTISGLYRTTGEKVSGLFGFVTSDGEVKNLRITNSYFESTHTSSNEAMIGSVAGRLEGNMDTVYSDAIVVSYGKQNGGLVGVVRGTGEKHITNCWFDGQLKLLGENVRWGGGIAGILLEGPLTIEHCLNTASIVTTKEVGPVTVGGLLGVVQPGQTIVMKDCMNTGVITAGTSKIAVNGIIGEICGTATITDAYYTRESWPNSAWAKSATASIDGFGIKKKEAEILGYDSYRKLNLDFSNYWAVKLSDTPILKSFSSNTPSLAGVKKLYNTDWYWKNPDAKEFVLNTMEDLYGLAEVIRNTNFKGRTIKLGKDIVVNAGNAADWELKSPYNVWVPIGNEQAFCGTFDGQGHTISGLYAKSDEKCVGLFGFIGEGSTVKNLRITNSYFESTHITSNEAMIGSVVGRCEGNLDTVYSDALVVSYGKQNGGLVGALRGEGLHTFTNCWFAGTLRMSGNEVRWGGGILGLILNGSLEMRHCLNTGTIITDKESGPVTMGGLMGVVQSYVTDVAIKDSMNTGKIIVGDSRVAVNAIVGEICGKTTVKNVYYTSDSWSGVAWAKTLTAEIDGSAVKAEREDILGYDGYKLTSLDFDTYWAVVLNDTPILKSFAKTIPSLDGVQRAYDTSWYWKDPNAKEYVLTTAQELYGLAEIVRIDNLAGRTIKLGADITINTGDANTWETTKPENRWIPIGRTQAFAGTFDGQGHSISGLYSKSAEKGVGLFSFIAQGSSVKNLKIRNSYFESTHVSSSEAMIGSVVGRCEGSLSSVYSDAIVVSYGKQNGGLVGVIRSDGSEEHTISNCQFAGKLYLKGEDTRWSGGIAGIVLNGTLKVEHCLSSGTITSDKTAGPVTLGGLLGVVQSSVTEVVIRDSMNSATITAGDSKIAVNAVVGEICGTAKIENVYYTAGSWSGAAWAKTTDAKITGGASKVSENTIFGYEAHKTLSLDFDKYWAIYLGELPILQSYSSLTTDPTQVKHYGNTDWYWENPEADEFEISTVADLYGLADLSGNVSFKGKTIKLKNDIIVNTGNAEDWKQTPPSKQWTPIKNFDGILDGQKHSISGIYVNSSSANTGLFSTITGGEVRSLSLVNSYLVCSAEDYTLFGSIAGSAGGTLRNIYTNAILETTVGRCVGGLVGFAAKGSKLTMESCWFDGKMFVNYVGQYTADTGGFIGIDRSGVLIDTCLYTGEMEIRFTRTAFRMTNWDARVSAAIGSAENEEIEVKESIVAGKIHLIWRKNPSVDQGDLGIINHTGYVVGRASKKTTIADMYISTNITSSVEGQADTAIANYIIGRDEGASPKRNVGIFTSDAELFGKGQNDLPYLQFTRATGDTTSPIWLQRDFALPIPASLAGMSSETVDTSWYDANASVMTIDSVADLYGFYRVAGSITSAQTVKLGADIILNTGNAADWATNPPENEWTPIASFAGTFDGDNHKISGLYVNSTAVGAGVGLFQSTAATSKILNLKIENSYFKWSSASQGAAYLGSVAGIAQGEIKNVQSNAIIDATNAKTVGGLVGYGIGNSMRLESCCYDGILTLNYTGTGLYMPASGGLMGATKSKLTTFDTCLFSGEIKLVYPSTGNLGGTDWCAQVGGFIGISDNNDAYLCNIINSLSAGTITLDYQSADSIPTSVSMVQQFAGRLMGGTNANKNQFKNICGASTVVLKTPTGSTTYSSGNGNPVLQLFFESPMTTALSNQSYKDKTELVGASISNLYFATSGSYAGPIWQQRTGAIPMPAALCQ